jgi:hypothetical protein
VEDAASHCHRIVGFCMLLGLGAHAASATPAPKGCPAEPSGWVEVSYVTSPTEDWTKTSLYTFLFEDTTIGQLAIDELGFSSQEDVYFFIVLQTSKAFRSTGTATAGCVDWIGGLAPGLPDWVFSLSDNNANAA